METGGTGNKKLSSKEYRDLMAKLSRIRTDAEGYEGKPKARKYLFILLIVLFVLALLPLVCIKGLAAGEITAELKKRTYHAFVKDKYAYLSVEYGLLVYDVSDPSKPVELGSYMIPGSAVSSFVEGETAYLSGGPEGIFLIDVSDKKNLRLISKYDTKGSAMSSVKAGDMLFIADGSMGVSVIDVKDKVNPVFGYSIEVEDYTRSVIVDDGMLYVSDGRKGVKSFDTKGTGAAKPVKSLNLGCEARELIESGGKILAACGSGGVKVFDKALSENAILTFPTKDFSRGISVKGDLLFSADGNSGVLIYDLKKDCSKDKTCLVSKVTTTGTAVRVAEHNGFLYISNDYSGLVIVDIADPAKPSIVFPKKP
ncbi:MAG: hypothetical protein FJ088_15775 [Deltaproteobacteria bacterium]|nr:hypothetical protein [Deltaproteobacteria bacterium]